MTIQETLQNNLNSVRQNLYLLDNYGFDKAKRNSNHFERLRLNIAIYNDFQQTDYEIVKFLFIEEIKWRRDPDEKDGDVDNLYFSAFILTLFNNPEIIWLFLDAKNIDFDSGIGLDGEYLVSTGIENTYKYLDGVEKSAKTDILEYIGETAAVCNYSQEEIDDWKEFKNSYFKVYTYPTEDELYFLFSLNERELFLQKLPEWIEKDRKWTYQELSLFKTYAKYSEDKLLEIESLELAIKKNDQDFLIAIYKKELAELFIETNQQAKAVEMLNTIILYTDNKNIIRDCVELLCKIIIIRGFADLSKTCFEAIKKQQKKYGIFSPNVDRLINEVKQIMGS